MSNFQKFDQQLNLIKTKVLETLIHLLEYTFQYLNNDEKSRIPYIIKMEGVIPLIIKTAHQFATHADLQQLLLDDVKKDFIVELIEVLIILSGESNYNDIFVQN